MTGDKIYRSVQNMLCNDYVHTLSWNKMSKWYWWSCSAELKFMQAFSTQDFALVISCSHSDIISLTNPDVLVVLLMFLVPTDHDKVSWLWIAIFISGVHNTHLKTCTYLHHTWKLVICGKNQWQHFTYVKSYMDICFAILNFAWSLTKNP